MKEKNYKILIVDDDDETRETYTEKFKEAGFTVFTAKDGLEGFDAVSKNIPDLIFTGIIMPRMSGFDLIEALKKNVRTAHIPVVISSHLGRQEDLKRARELGAFDFILKGEVPLTQVVDRVERVLGKRFIYQVGAEKDKYDIHALAQILGANTEFTCPDDGSDLVLNIEYFPNKKSFSINAVCPVCGERGGK